MQGDIKLDGENLLNTVQEVGLVINSKWGHWHLLSQCVGVSPASATSLIFLYTLGGSR